jgi:protein-tyrosine phosphatase
LLSKSFRPAILAAQRLQYPPQWNIYFSKWLVIMKKIKVLFVCMGNICRSPTAEGVFSKLVTEKQLEHQFAIDSAGTHAYHIGEAPDLRAQRARKVVMGDFEDFDFLLAMDDDNYATLISACPAPHKHKVQYFLDYAPQLREREVPDPYYGGQYGFERVLDMVEAAAIGFLTALQSSGRIG